MAISKFPSGPADALAVIKLDNPPVNALSHAARQRIVSELTQAEADPAITAVILIGTDEIFSGGADVKEFNSPQAAAEQLNAFHLRLAAVKPRDDPAGGFQVRRRTTLPSRTTSSRASAKPVPPGENRFSG